MTKSGWFRLWVFLSCILVAVAMGWTAYSVWGKEVCYRLVTVSIATDAQPQDRILAERIWRERGANVFCGPVQYTEVLTLEGLAQQGAVTQISVEWLAPRGWSFDKFNAIAVFDGEDITADKISTEVAGAVHQARLRRAAAPLLGVLGMSVSLLSLGLGFVWVRRGFLSTPEGA